MPIINLEQIYYLTQIIAVIALILTLIYVAQQIKQNAMPLRLNAYQATASSYLNLDLGIAKNEEFAKFIGCISKND